MKIDMQTKIHIVSKKDGHLSESTMTEWYLSLVGGSRWDEYEITTDMDEAKAISDKYKRIAKIVKRLNQLSPDLACQTVDDFSAILDHIIEKSRARDD